MNVEGSTTLAGMSKILDEAVVADGEFSGGNKSAGKRLRKFMQDIKKSAQTVRKEVLTRRKAMRKAESVEKKRSKKEAKSSKSSKVRKRVASKKS